MLKNIVKTAEKTPKMSNIMNFTPNIKIQGKGKSHSWLAEEAVNETVFTGDA